MKNLYISLSILIVFLGTSCDKVLLYDEIPNDPVNNFEYLWKDFDQHYGLFGVKHINWDSLYSVYRPEVTNEMSEEQFYNVIVSMLNQLNDNHVGVYPVNSDQKPHFCGIIGRIGNCTDFKMSVVKDNYLEKQTKYDDEIIYGMLNNNIGYMHIMGYGSSMHHYEKAFDEMLDYMKDTRGIIIDIRSHDGGNDHVGRYIAGRFATEKKLFQIVRLKNGPAHDEFTEPMYDYVEPQKGSTYSKPLALLTNRFSLSAAETGTLAMRTLDNLTHIGDTTSGAFSDMVMRELPNGWAYSMSIGMWNDSNDKNWEGIGIIPDIAIKNDSADVANGIDKILEYAIDYLSAK